MEKIDSVTPHPIAVLGVFDWLLTHLTLGVTIAILVLVSQSKFLRKILLDFLVGQLLTHTL